MPPTVFARRYDPNQRIRFEAFKLGSQDALEVAAAGADPGTAFVDSLSMSDAAWIIYADSKPIGGFGYRYTDPKKNCGAIWLLHDGSISRPSVAKVVLKEAPKYLRLVLTTHCPFLANRVYAQNSSAVSLIRRLGGKVFDQGGPDEDGFYQFYFVKGANDV